MSDGNNFFMIDHLCCFKLFDTENTVQDERVSTQLESWTASFYIFRNMQIHKILVNIAQFYCGTDILEIVRLNPILPSSYLNYCIFHKGLAPSYHHKSICWKILHFFRLTIPSDKVSRFWNLSSYYWNLFLLLLILLPYLLTISHYKVNLPFMVAITLFSTESEENVPCWEMPFSVDSVRQSRFCWYISVRTYFCLFW